MSRNAESRIEPLTDPFRVGDWLALPASSELVRGEVTLRLEPKVMEVLATLAARPGEVVRREALLAAVWPNVYVTEDVLWRAISELRKVLGDPAQQPRLLETLPRRGYRLLAPVERGAPLPPVVPVAPEELEARRGEASVAPPPTAPESNGGFAPGWWGVPGHRVAVGSLLVVLAALGGLWALGERGARSPRSHPASASGAAAATPAAVPQLAEDYYRLGVEAYWRSDLVDRARALEFFRRATQLDPRHALAWSGLADSYTMLFLNNDGDRRGLDEALGAARRALAVAPELSEAHRSLGLVEQAGGHLVAAVREYRAAIALRPDYVAPRYNLASALTEVGALVEALALTDAEDATGAIPLGHRGARGEILRLLGRTDEARRLADESAARDPYSVRVLRLLVRLDLGAGAIDAARQRLAPALALQRGDARLLGEAARIEHYAGRIAEARRLLDLRAGLPRPGEPSDADLRRAALDLAAGETAAARSLLQGVRAAAQAALAEGQDRAAWPFHLAIAAGLEGKTDEALRWLAAAEGAGYLDLAQLQSDPLLAPLRDEPRFAALVERLRLRVGLMRDASLRPADQAASP